jgi:sodium transport system permease protein
MRAVWIVMLKELRDLLRDRRTVMISLLMGPVLLPFAVIGMMSMAASKQSTQMEQVLALPVIGAEHAPNLVAWLEGQNIEIKPPPDDATAALLEQAEEVILRISPEFGEDWRGSRPALVELLHDATRQDSQIPLQRVRGLLEQYGAQVGALRLLARGINPGVAQAVRVGQQDVSTPEARRGMLLAMMLPYLLILMAFIGVSYVVVDVTAGERERQSLEPLLATPAAREAIMSGKIAAACVFGLLGLALTLIGLKIGFSLVPIGRMPVDLSFATVGALLLVLAPIVLIGATLLTLIAASVKSVKEAQSYMGMLMMIPIVPPVVLMIHPIKTQLWMFAIPFLAQNQMIGRVVRSEAVSAQEWGVYFAAGLGLAVVLWLIAGRLYHREKLAISA